MLRNRMIWLGVALGLTGGCGSTDSMPSTGNSGASTTTTSSSSLSSAAAGICPEASFEDECSTCMADACCDALAECQGDADCTACVEGTESDACEKTAETHARVDAFLQCEGGACKSECIGRTMGSCEGVLDGVVAHACVDCLEMSCCDETAACHGSDGCWIDCFTEHDEAKCHGDVDGHALFHALGACASTSCDTECN